MSVLCMCTLECLRLIFPTLQKSDSPFSILPQWLNVLGRKIDSASAMQDTLFVLLESFGSFFFAVRNMFYIIVFAQEKLQAKGKNSSRAKEWLGSNSCVTGS